MGDLPTPPYTEATAPIGVFSPALDAAVGAVREAGYPITVEQANALLIGVRAAAPGLIASGRAQAADDLIGLIPREYAQILAWLSRHRLGLAPGAGAVLSWLRRDMDALVASWAGGVADLSKDPHAE